MVAGQEVALGRGHAHQSVTVAVSETTLAIEPTDGETRVVRRTTETAVRSIKGQRPRTAGTIVPRRNVKQVLTQIRQGPTASTRDARPGSTRLCAYRGRHPDVCDGDAFAVKRRGWPRTGSARWGERVH